MRGIKTSILVFVTWAAVAAGMRLEPGTDEMKLLSSPAFEPLSGLALHLRRFRDDIPTILTEISRKGYDDNSVILRHRANILSSQMKHALSLLNSPEMTTQNADLTVLFKNMNRGLKQLKVLIAPLTKSLDTHNGKIIMKHIDHCEKYASLLHPVLLVDMPAGSSLDLQNVFPDTDPMKLLENIHKVHSLNRGSSPESLEAARQNIKLARDHADGAADQLFGVIDKIRESVTKNERAWEKAGAAAAFVGEHIMKKVPDRDDIVESLDRMEKSLREKRIGTGKIESKDSNKFKWQEGMLHIKSLKDAVVPNLIGMFEKLKSAESHLGHLEKSIGERALSFLPTSIASKYQEVTNIIANLLPGVTTVKKIPPKKVKLDKNVSLETVSEKVGEVEPNSKAFSVVGKVPFLSIL